MKVKSRASLVAQLVKNPPAMQETLVWFLGWKISWRREQLPTPVFWPGEFHGQRSPAGYSLLSCKESDTTVWFSLSHGLSSSHVQMWELDSEEGRAPEKWCFWTVALEKTLESPLDCKEIKPVILKGNQCWIFIRRTDAKAELQYFGHLMWRADSLENTLMLGKIEGRRRRGQRGWDGWTASSIQWTWVWANSRR